MKNLEDDLDRTLKNTIAILQKRIIEKNHYMGVKTIKNPLDFWIYREMIFDHNPDVIIEIGNFNGGSALAFAHILDLMGKGRLIGLDLDHSHIPESIKNHPRITLIEGDACKNIDQVRSLVSAEESVLIFEDSAHTYQNSLNVLEAYKDFIKPGDYIVIEDTICYHGLDEGPSPGGYEACEEFIQTNPDFEIDREKEDFGITWNPKGFVRRKGDTIQATEVNKGVNHSQVSDFKRNFRKLYINLMPPILVHMIRKIRKRS